MIKDWVRNIFILIIALTFIEILMPSSRIKPYIKFVFSLVIMASILEPLLLLLE
jgi:stage III sporulation protein AF